MNTKVLLVDDSKLFRMANEPVLSKAGFEISTAADGEEALQVANDAILLFFPQMEVDTWQKATLPPLV